MTDYKSKIQPTPTTFHYIKDATNEQISSENSIGYYVIGTIDENIMVFCRLDFETGNYTSEKLTAGVDGYKLVLTTSYGRKYHNGDSNELYVKDATPTVKKSTIRVRKYGTQQSHYVFFGDFVDGVSVFVQELEEPSFYRNNRDIGYVFDDEIEPPKFLTQNGNILIRTDQVRFSKFYQRKDPDAEYFHVYLSLNNIVASI